MKPRVLVIDDSPMILEMVSAALSADGYEVVTAVDLSEFDRATQRFVPDLVILDVQMPEAFGDELGETLREVRRVQVPMLLFSNLADHELEQRANAAGLSGFVPKRAGIRALIDRVRSLVPQNKLAEGAS
ncbi:MAG: response regulator [Polyangiales bacterium]